MFITADGFRPPTAMEEGHLTHLIRDAIDDSSRKLLRVAIPPVRYSVLSEVMGKDKEDHILRRALEETEAYPPKIRLLRRIKEDGTWRVPKKCLDEPMRPHEKPEGWVYTVILKNLSRLIDLQANKDEGRIALVLERILSWQSKEGYIPGDWTYALPIPSKNGCVLWELAAFGMGNDPRVRRIADWLISIQRQDGGWNIPYRQDLMYRSKYRDAGVEDFLTMISEGKVSDYAPEKFSKVPSCHWTTTFVLWGLAESRSHNESRAIKRGADFLLERFFKKNPHPGFWPNPSDWTKLDYPLFEGKGLTALDALTRLGYGESDDRMLGPMRWLVAARSEDGFWRRWTRPYRESDQWITLTALRILSRYLSNH